MGNFLDEEKPFRGEYIITVNKSVVTHEGEPMRFSTRLEAWAAIRDDDTIVSNVVMPDECTCFDDEDGDELCDRCALPCHLRLFAADQAANILAGKDVTFFANLDSVHNGVTVRVRPAPHWHAITSDGDDDEHGPYRTLREACQAASEYCKRVAEQASSLAAHYGDMGDRSGADETMETSMRRQLCDRYHGEAYRLTREADDMGNHATNLDIDARESAPLFQGPDGKKKLTETMEHLVSMMPFRAPHTGVHVDVRKCDVELCWGHQ